jgi:4-hydroxy-2-oxoheptanedioate aldolase
MQANSTKAKLSRGELVFGPLITAADPRLVELAAEAGMDFVRIDGEHGPMTLETIENMVRAAEASGITPTARIPANRDEVVLSYLDRGLCGIIFPHVTSGDDAREAVRNMKFAPMGQRGYSGAGGFVRWTMGIKEQNVYEFANRETLCVCLVEDIEGVKNTERIAEVPGVDVVYIGPGDLAQSMGYLGQRNHPEVLKAIEDCARRARSVGKAAGITLGTPARPEEARRYIDIGMQMFSMNSAELIGWAMRDFVAKVKA